MTHAKSRKDVRDAARRYLESLGVSDAKTARISVWRKRSRAD